MPINNSSSNGSFYSYPCFDSIISGHMHNAYAFISILLLLPLSVFVLSMGFQRWKQQRSVSSAAVMSLSDFVTYNMAVIELIGVFGNTIAICGGYAGLYNMVWSGIFIGAFPWYGQMEFPILACVERYLAAVHPIIYLRLRQVYGVRIRNISTMCVWLQCFTGVGGMMLMIQYPDVTLIQNTFHMALFLTATIFCCVSVLCVLIRPRPGETGGDRSRVDQSKQRAFRTIMIIMGVLLLRFGGNLVCNVVSFSPTVSYRVQCVAKASTGWVNLPSSLVLPLLFLHKAGKLPGCGRLRLMR